MKRLRTFWFTDLVYWRTFWFTDLVYWCVLSEVRCIYHVIEVYFNFTLW